MNYILLALALITPSFGDNSHGDARDRCKTENCVCSVVVEEVDSHPLWEEIFFKEDSAKLPEDHGLESWKDKRSVIFAMTDGCGESSYNKSLAKRRLDSATKILPYATGYALGKITDKHNPDARKIVIINGHARILQLLMTNPADYYLLDGSGSMKGHWREVRQFPFPKDSEVFVAKVSGCKNNQSIKYINPSGKTEIWYPYWYILKIAKPGSKLLIVSDFRSTYPLSDHGYQMIEDLAKKKNIDVLFIKY